MTILQLQRRLAEVGRLRIGQSVETRNGKTRPVKLDTWRVTSADRARVDRVAALYGGQPAPWQSPSGQQQWEVVTEVDALPVIVPPSDMAFSQHYEKWGSGGCLRRCDGAQESLSDGPCLCDPEQRECEIHTRLSVMLRDVPGLGVYRIDTQGYYAAVELQGAMEVVELAASQGSMIPARLRLEQRSIKRQGEERRDFAVPVLDLEVSPAQLLSGSATAGMLSSPAAGQLDEGREYESVEPEALAAPMTPVPAENQRHEPAPDVGEQLQRAAQQPTRRRSQQPIPDPGLPDDPQPEPAADSGPSEGRERPVTETQRKRIMAACGQAGLDDQARHELIRVATHGHTQSSTKVPQYRLEQLLVLVEAVELGVVDLRYHPDGEAYLAFLANEEPVALPLDVARWRERLDAIRGEREPEQPALDSKESG